MSGPLLEAAGLGKTFGGGALTRRSPVVALRDFELGFADDEARIVALAGQSGSGKTTAAQLVLGFAHPTTGEVRYRGRSLRALGRNERREFRREVQAVLQDPYGAFNPFYRVRHVFDVAARNFGVADATRAVADAFAFVGLDASRFLDRFPHELSGGERQRLMIARALLLRPKLIVADEPVSMIDASLRASILDIIIRLNKDEGISFLYITHDLSTAYHIADDLVVLFEGETVERGPARTVIDSPQHPYTRTLVESVPVPDPDVRWTRAPAAVEERDGDRLPLSPADELDGDQPTRRAGAHTGPRGRRAPLRLPARHLAHVLLRSRCRIRARRRRPTRGRRAADGGRARRDRRHDAPLPIRRARADDVSTRSLRRRVLADYDRRRRRAAGGTPRGGVRAGALVHERPAWCVGARVRRRRGQARVVVRRSRPGSCRVASRRRRARAHFRPSARGRAAERVPTSCGLRDAAGAHRRGRRGRRGARAPARRGTDGHTYLPMVLGGGEHHVHPGAPVLAPEDGIRPETATWALAHAIYPGEVFEVDDDLVQGFLHLLKLRDGEEHVPATTGWLPYRALWTCYASFAAHTFLWAGDPEKAIEYLYGFANHAAPTRVWREEQPLRNAGHATVNGDMPHNWASAELIRLVRNLLVFERGGELHLLPALPEGWLPLRIETPTRSAASGSKSIPAGSTGASARTPLRPPQSWRTCRRAGGS